ncbi:DNA repair protein complementing XP-C cells homolog [Venturia canescens]|uniref:DNA repair protein complementing XP-C cells homolog n=1 Tax=Venturia canescens TaxID=32260 RepID=UPI001C9C2AE4|nr:DNA repair protein complementing XP-C cells homolog [Venturia canescens]
MSLSSDDESSDSSGAEYLIQPGKLNLESSFFKRSTSNTTKSSDTNKINEVSDSSDSDDDFHCVDDEKDSATLLAEVMKNLENANKTNASIVENNVKEEKEGLKKESPKKEDKHVLSNEIANLLLQGETGTSSFVPSSNEDVEETKPLEYTIPKEGVNIILPGTDMMFRRQKKSNSSIEDVLRRKINQRLRSNQIYIHKTGLLCWLAHGFHLNKQINDAEVLATALSLVPSTSYPKGRTDLKYLEQFTKWFKNLITIEFKEVDEAVKKETLLVRLKEKKVHNYRELVLLCIATLRAIGLTCRLVISMCPPPLKPSGHQLFQKPKSEVKDEKNNEKPSRTSAAKISKQGKRSSKNEKMRSGAQESSSKIIPENSSVVDEGLKTDAKKRAASILTKFANTQNKKSIKTLLNQKSSTSGTVKSPDKKGNSGDSQEKEVEKVTSQEKKRDETKSLKSNADHVQSPPRTRTLRSRVIEQNSRANSVKVNKTVHFEEEIQKPNEKESTRRTRARKVPAPSTSKKADSDSDFEMEEKSSKNQASTSQKHIMSESDSDDEFEPKPPPKKRKIIHSKKSDSPRVSIDRRVLSSDEEESSEIVDAKGAQNVWIEVYVESEESWISISVPDNKIHCVSEIYKKAPKPVLYVVAWNSVGTLKDVTRRYCPHWLTETRKKRVDENWWTETLLPWKENDSVLSKAEDEMLLQRELEQPLPTTVGECKGHPLYVLTRHLLKFEALYPPECVPLGHTRTGEAIYSRHCVHTLCSRETWIKKARVVKPAQIAYKTVKALPKYDKLSGIKLKDQPLELFGKWQTTPYVPPEAKNGIVPRNEYGNVDLFQQCMLPKGTVHINLPGLNRIARKLGIDCSPAVVGFNFGCRGALPAFEGFVVCEEFEDTLREAWETEQIEAHKRAVEKREKRIYGNWKKLIKGLFIRERLAARYDFTNDDDDNNDDEKKPSSSSKHGKSKASQTKKSNAKKVKTS